MAAKCRQLHISEGLTCFQRVSLRGYRCLKKVMVFEVLGKNRKACLEKERVFGYLTDCLKIFRKFENFRFKANFIMFYLLYRMHLCSRCNNKGFTGPCMSFTIWRNPENAYFSFFYMKHQRQGIICLDYLPKHIPLGVNGMTVGE